jgi:hypothetical protein
MSRALDPVGGTTVHFCSREVPGNAYSRGAAAHETGLGGASAPTWRSAGESTPAAGRDLDLRSDGTLLAAISWPRSSRRGRTVSGAAASRGLGVIATRWRIGPARTVDLFAGRRGIPIGRHLCDNGDAGRGLNARPGLSLAGPAAAASSPGQALDRAAAGRCTRSIGRATSSAVHRAAL